MTYEIAETHSKSFDDELKTRFFAAGGRKQSRMTRRVFSPRAEGSNREMFSRRGRKEEGRMTKRVFSEDLSQMSTCDVGPSFVHFLSAIEKHGFVIRKRFLDC